MKAHVVYSGVFIFICFSRFDASDVVQFTTECLRVYSFHSHKIFYQLKMRRFFSVSSQSFCGEHLISAEGKNKDEVSDLCLSIRRNSLSIVLDSTLRSQLTASRTASFKETFGLLSENLMNASFKMCRLEIAVTVCGG